MRTPCALDRRFMWIGTRHNTESGYVADRGQQFQIRSAARRRTARSRRDRPAMIEKLARLGVEWLTTKPVHLIAADRDTSRTPRPKAQPVGRPAIAKTGPTMSPTSQVTNGCIACRTYTHGEDAMRERPHRHSTAGRANGEGGRGSPNSSNPSAITRTTRSRPTAERQVAGTSKPKIEPKAARSRSRTIRAAAQHHADARTARPGRRAGRRGFDHHVVRPAPVAEQPRRRRGAAGSSWRTCPPRASAPTTHRVRPAERDVAGAVGAELLAPGAPRR